MLDVEIMEEFSAIEMAVRIQCFPGTKNSINQGVGVISVIYVA